MTYDKFIKTLPHIGFTDLNPDVFQKLIDIIRQEPELSLQRFYFGLILNILFGSAETARLFQKNEYTYCTIPEWIKTKGYHLGWFVRLGQATYPAPRELSVGSLPGNQQEAAIKVLHMVRRMHDELKYEPSYIDVIYYFSREFNSPYRNYKEAPFIHESVKTLRAMIAFNQGQKVPRKMKKHIKNLQQNSR